MVGHSSQSIEAGQKDICVFTPSIAQLQEVVLLLNPLYNGQIDDAFELLIRHGFSIVKHTSCQLLPEDVDEMFGGKFSNTDEGKSVKRLLVTR